MLGVGRDDFVAPGEAKGGEHRVAPLRRRRRERDGFRCRPDEAPDGFPQPPARRHHLLEEGVAEPSHLERAPLLRLHRFHGAAGERPERSGVQVRAAFRGGKLGPDGREVYAITASTGA